MASIGVSYFHPNRSSNGEYFTILGSSGSWYLVGIDPTNGQYEQYQISENLASGITSLFSLYGDSSNLYALAFLNGANSIIKIPISSTMATTTQVITDQQVSSTYQVPSSNEKETKINLNYLILKPSIKKKVILFLLF